MKIGCHTGRTAGLACMLITAVISIGCLTYNSGFKSMDEVQKGESIVFGEIILLRITEKGSLEDVPAVDNRIKFTAI